jgi:hypothetical protein
MTVLLSLKCVPKLWLLLMNMPYLHLWLSTSIESWLTMVGNSWSNSFGGVHKVMLHFGLKGHRILKLKWNIHIKCCVIMLPSSTPCYSSCLCCIRAIVTWVYCLVYMVTSITCVSLNTFFNKSNCGCDISL